ncbi:unnamed protein product, partial [Amoebophrya sp. A25]
CLFQPFGTFFCVSSKEPDPLAVFQQILHLNTNPTLCRRGVLEGNAPRLKVLIHDMGDPQSPS